MKNNNNNNNQASSPPEEHKQSQTQQQQQQQQQSQSQSQQQSNSTTNTNNNQHIKSTSLSQSSANYDTLNCKEDKLVVQQLEPNEQIVLSRLVLKYNYKGKKQQRILLITNKHVYNIAPHSFIKDIFANVFSSLKIKRKISLNKIQSITVSRLGFEFVIHVPDEYDYRYSSEKRNEIIEVLAQTYFEVTKSQKLKFFFTDDLTLFDFTTTKFDKQRKMSEVNGKVKLQFGQENTENRDLSYEDLKGGLQKAINQDSSKIVFSQKSTKEATLEDFSIIKVVGRGAFGKVMLIEHKLTKEIYAMKSIRKDDIIEKDQLEHTKAERQILSELSHPLLVGLVYAFQTPSKIFFVMPFMRGGELFQHLKNARRFPEERAKFYIIEIIIALAYLHSKNIIYRDLKPENVLLNDIGHIALTDFGLARFVGKTELIKSFVGTPEYLAPEVLKGEAIDGKMVDWWSVGTILYEMLIGIPPFYSENQEQMFQMIRKMEPRFPNQIQISDKCKNFLNSLLNKDPKKRLGSQDGANEIQKHPWFEGINFEDYPEKITPPFKPNITGKLCTDNFDEEFTNEAPINSMVNQSKLNFVKKYQSQFEGFTFVQENVMKQQQKQDENEND